MSRIGNWERITFDKGRKCTWYNDERQEEVRVSREEMLGREGKTGYNESGYRYDIEGRHISTSRQNWSKAMEKAREYLKNNK